MSWGWWHLAVSQPRTTNYQLHGSLNPTTPGPSPPSFSLSCFIQLYSASPVSHFDFGTCPPRVVVTDGWQSARAGARPAQVTTSPRSVRNQVALSEPDHMRDFLKRPRVDVAADLDRSPSGRPMWSLRAVSAAPRRPRIYHGRLGRVVSHHASSARICFNTHKGAGTCLRNYSPPRKDTPEA